MSTYHEKRQIRSSNATDFTLLRVANADKMRNEMVVGAIRAATAVMSSEELLRGDARRLVRDKVLEQGLLPGPVVLDIVEIQAEPSTPI